VLGNLGGWPGYQISALESSDAVRALSELGLLVLLFLVGLETDISRIRKTEKTRRSSPRQASSRRLR